MRRVSPGHDLKRTTFRSPAKSFEPIRRFISERRTEEMISKIKHLRRAPGRVAAGEKMNFWRINRKFEAAGGGD
jgi:hypothetical protein